VTYSLTAGLFHLFVLVFHNVRTYKSHYFLLKVNQHVAFNVMWIA